MAFDDRRREGFARLSHRHRCRRHLHEGRADRQCDACGRRPALRAHHPRPMRVAWQAASSRCSARCWRIRASRRSDVVFLAHSTTQATNALLEGDVAHASAWSAWPARAAAALAEKQARSSRSSWRRAASSRTANRFLVTDGLEDCQVRKAIAELCTPKAPRCWWRPARSASTTPRSEELVRRLAVEAGLLTTCGHEITRLYGLTTRTRTAVINASILPRMIATARHDGSQRARGRHWRTPDDHARRRRRDGHRGDAPAPGDDDAVRAGGQRGGRADALARFRRHLLRGRRHLDQCRRDPQWSPDRDLCARRRPRDLRQLARRAGDRHCRRQPGARGCRRSDRRRAAQRAHCRAALCRLCRCRSDDRSACRAVRAEARRRRRLRRRARGKRRPLRAHRTPAQPTCSATPSPACMPMAIPMSARLAFAALARHRRPQRRGNGSCSARCAQATSSFPWSRR